METADQPICSHIQRLPDEVLARLFIVCSWLPSRTLPDNSDETSNSPNTMHTLRLKPYAKLVSQVCARWRAIVHWHCNRHELFHAVIALKTPEWRMEPSNFVPRLKVYLDGLTNSEDVELDVEWYFPKVVMHGLTAAKHVLLRLFLHGMNLTVPHFSRVRTLKVDFGEPQLLVFLFLILNYVGCDLVLNHLKISTSRYLSRTDLTLELPFMPTCAPLNNSPTGTAFQPLIPFNTLTDMTLRMDIGIVEKFIIPPSLLHLSLSDSSNITRWNSLWSIIQQCGSLHTLMIDFPVLTILPRRSGIPTITLARLSELTFLHAKVLDLAIVLPLLTTPRLKHLYFGWLFEREADAPIESQKIAAAWFAPSLDRSLRTFAAPGRLSLRATDYRDLRTFAKLFACMTPDAVEQICIDHAGFDRYDLLSNGNPEFSRIRQTLEIRFIVQAVFTLFRQHSGLGKDVAMPRVRVKNLNGKLLYKSWDNADGVPNYFESPI